MKNRKGSLLVDALVGILIISLSIGIAYVPSYFLLRRSQENWVKMELAELILNKCEELVYKNASSITSSTTQENYKGKTYKLTITRSTSSTRFTVSSTNTNKEDVFEFYPKPEQPKQKLYF